MRHILIVPVMTIVVAALVVFVSSTTANIPAEDMSCESVCSMGGECCFGFPECCGPEPWPICEGGDDAVDCAGVCFGASSWVESTDGALECIERFASEPG